MLAIGQFTQSSSFRVGALLTFLAISAMLLVSYFLKTAYTTSVQEHTAQTLTAHSQALTIIIQHALATEDFTSLNDYIDALDNQTYIGVTLNNQFWGGNIKQWPSFSPSQNPSEAVLVPYNLTPNDNTTRTLSMFKTIDNAEFSVFIGRDIALSNAKKRTYVLSTLFLLTALCLISFAVAVYVVNRINRMSVTASRIMDTGNLSERLDIDSKWDDLSRLAVVLNKMLDAIEMSVENLKSVTDNIAHDLRTPLTRLKNSLEKIEDAKTREETTSEANKLLSIFNSLLRISRIETLEHKAGFEVTALNQVIDDAVDLYLPLAQQKQIELTLKASKIEFRCDPNLVFQCVANVLDNAIKHTSTDGKIQVQVSEFKGKVVVSVNDSGSGVPIEMLSKIEDRFYRSDNSRTSKGNGLGLSLVSAIIRLHKGKLWFVPDPLNVGHGLGVVLVFTTDAA
ncbi:HAMP domain-containing sensor histidine kinase [Alteromonas sp. KUL49]|uniref:HAMP domain-containing sensor histidine kinase n=1 Tax=Alteromonas sp. KUL49 TaxID=2480798 RepID=UPI00102EDD31|nr:HAMP domain-containing sensor histidine kinase [Alteromonas sp. KUL49]TAP41650.1 HAMP domain-containing histidine kinase [Alteromonas sp. KUL49]GEA10754.1 two-component sensor histidine kinase [Alteromonas sp. KUL49]